MDGNSALFKYKWPTFRMTVYPGYIDLWERCGLLSQEETIMISEATAVGISRTGRLQLTTRDGTTRKLTVGTKAKKAKAAVLQAMRAR